jgi:magnesium transporter
LVVRGLATGRVNVGNNLSIILKEIRVGIILGILYGLLLGLFAIIQFVEISPYLGLVVGLGIAGSMLIATAFGSLVPLLLQRLDVDPAIATGPFVTTSIDILGVSLYLGIANFFLTA